MARRAESSYNSRLRQIAKQIDALVRGLAPNGEVKDVGVLVSALNSYAVLITPWARSVARYMLADVNQRNARAWKKIGTEMGRALRAEIAYAPTGMLFSALQDEQVALITSLPRKAAQRVHDLTQEGMLQSRRAEDIAQDILATGRVTENRAKLIARTEVSRAASNLTQARAMFAGSQGYVWRTSMDADVRETHQEMEGVYVPWSTPPKTDKSLAPYHAGCGPNCRCYPDPVLPDL